MANVLIFRQSKVVTLLWFLSLRVFLLIQINMSSLLRSVNSRHITESIETSFWTVQFESSKQQCTSATVSDEDFVSYWSIKTSTEHMLSVDRPPSLHRERFAFILTHKSASNDESILKTAQTSEVTNMKPSLGMTFSYLKNGTQTATPEKPPFSLHMNTREQFASGVLVLAQIKEISVSKVDNKADTTNTTHSPAGSEEFSLLTAGELTIASQNNIQDETGMPLSSTTGYSSVVLWTSVAQTVAIVPSDTVLIVTVPQSTDNDRNNTKNLVLTAYDTSASDPNNSLKWIIIGCALGTSVLIIIIIIVACLYPCAHRCLQTATDKTKTTDGNAKDDHQNKALPFNIYSVDNENIKPPLIQDRSGEEMAGPRKSTTSQTAFVHHNAAMENVKSKSGNRKMPKQKKIRKKSFKTEEDIQLVYKDQIAHLGTAVPETSSKIVATSSSQPTVEEESDLLENAEQERRRNKDRARAKNVIKNKWLSPSEVMNKMDIAYLNAQREMDQVLEPQSLKLKSLHRDTAIKKEDNIDINGEDNEAYKSDENYSLEKARQKMHKLLDDTFDVISQRKTNIVEKVQPSKEMRNEADSSNRQRNHPTSMEKIVQTEESMLSYKLHTPMQVHHSFVFNDPKGLIAWNPYRAFDDTTQISLNNPEANINTAQVMQENLGKSIFEQPFTPKSKYYATGPGEPIIIKTRNVEEDIIQNNAHKKMSILKHSQQSGINENLPSYIKSRNAFNSLMPVKSEDIYPNNSYELGCFQETPRTSQLIQVETGGSTRPSSPHEDAGRTALYTKGHKEPSKSVDQNDDIVDVIKESLQPGISPQPLIDSLRKELQILSSKAHTATKQANEETSINNSINLRNQ